MLQRTRHIFSRLRGEWLGLLRAVFRAWRNPPAYPVVLQVEHTNRCNLKCVMCAHGTGIAPKMPDMDMERFVHVLDEFKGANAGAGFRQLGHLHLQGVGEPFLHKKTLPMVRAARQRGISVGFVTNMTVMTDELARELVESGQETILVSVDAIDAEVFADIRRGAKFDVLERVLENLARIQRIKHELGASTPHVYINSLMMKRTLPQAPELVARLRELGAERIDFNDVLTHGMDPEMRFSDGSRCVDQTLFDLPHAEKMEVSATLEALSTPACAVRVPGEWGGSDGRAASGTIRTCADLWEKPYITAEGWVTPCCYAPMKESLPMGNLNTQSFEEIWFGPAYQRLRWQHLTGRAPGTCHKCSQFTETVAHTALRGGGDAPVYPRVFMGRGRFSLGLSTLRKARRFL